MTPARRPRVGHPVMSYTVQVTCPRCGGGLMRRAEGTPGLDTRAVASCPPCKRIFAVVAELVDVTTEITYVKAAPEEKAA